MKCPQCGGEYHTVFEQHEWHCHCITPSIHFVGQWHYPISVDFIWAGQDPMDGRLLAVNDQTHSATILTRENTKLHTKKWWIPKEDHQ